MNNQPHHTESQVAYRYGKLAREAENERMIKEADLDQVVPVQSRRFALTIPIITPLIAFIIDKLNR